MKKITLLVTLLCLIFSVQAQKLWQGGTLTINKNASVQEVLSSDFQEIKQDIDTRTFQPKITKDLVECETDTTLFLFVKSTSVSLDGLLTATNNFSSALQRYQGEDDAEVTVHGFDFYGFIDFDSTANITTLDLECNVWAADTSGGPDLDRGILATTTVTVDTTGFASPSISGILRQAFFDTPVTVAGSYFLELRNTSTTTTFLFVRNPVAQGTNPGGGLGFEDGWFVIETANGAFVIPGPELEGTGPSGAVFWDVDNFLTPYISYSIDANFQLAGDATCLPHDEAVAFENLSSSTVGNPYYNTFSAAVLLSNAPDTTFAWITDVTDPNASVVLSEDFINIYSAPTTMAEPGLLVAERGYFRFCIDSISIAYPSGPAVTADFSFTVDTNQTVMFENNSTGSSFMWDFGDGTTSTEVVPTHTYANGGNYEVSLAVSDSLSPCTDMLTLTVNVATTDIMDDLLNSQVKVYPNPSEGLFALELSMDQAEEVNVVVRNMVGQEVKRLPLGLMQQGELELDLRGQKSGIYLMTLWAGDRQITRKLSIQ